MIKMYLTILLMRGIFQISKYIGFEEILSTINAKNYDLRREIQTIEVTCEKRKNSVVFPLTEHVRGMVYAMLSNNRPWKGIEENIEKIDAIFHNFDIDYLLTVSPEELTRQIAAIHCGNRQIKWQMESLSGNIQTLQRIAADHGSIDHYYNSTDIDVVVKSLAYSGQKYKLNYMGLALVCEYLKGMGLDVIKPDVHVCRIIGRLGYSKHNPATYWEAIDVSRSIAAEYNLSMAAVDTILWQYGVENKLGICGAEPKCSDCLAEHCSARNQ